LFKVFSLFTNHWVSKLNKKTRKEASFSKPKFRYTCRSFLCEQCLYRAFRFKKI